MAIKNTCIIILILVIGLASLPQVVHAAPLSVTSPGSFSLSSTLPIRLTFQSDFGARGFVGPFLSVQAGRHASSTITVKSNYGFVGTLSLSVAIAPVVTNVPKVSLQTTLLTLTSGGTANTTLRVRTTDSTALGTYVLMVTGSSGSKTSSLRIFLRVASRALDGVGTFAICRSGPTHCATQLLTTTKGHDIIILLVQCFCQPETPSVIDSAGLNYTLRESSIVSFDTKTFRLWEYYATAEVLLTSDNITVVFPIRTYESSTQLFAIHPGDTETIFNPNLSLPVALPCPAYIPNVGYPSCSASVGPLEHAFAIAIMLINDAVPCPLSSGFSELTFDGSTLDVEYRIIGESQSDVMFTCIGGSGGTDPMAIVLDAISILGGH